MGNEIRTNTSSINAQRNLYRTNKNLNTSFQRQSSGFRINSARDDAAGLIISNQLSAQIVSQNVGIRNANDGVSISQTAEGALQEVTNILQRSRELALSAASGQNSPEARAAINAEFQALGAEVSRIAENTEFGGQNLLAGGTTFDIQTGADSGQTISVETPNVIDIGNAISATDVLTSDNASAALDVIDAQLAAVDTARVGLGASQNRLSSTISNLQNVAENTEASRSQIRDTDFAAETSNSTKNKILQQAGLSIAAQANLSNQAVLSLLK